MQFFFFLLLTNSSLYQIPGSAAEYVRIREQWSYIYTVTGLLLWVWVVHTQGTAHTGQ
jgi:hypothetical protein